jgi:hypothetical protein
LLADINRFDVADINRFDPDTLSDGPKR